MTGLKLTEGMWGGPSGPRPTPSSASTGKGERVQGDPRGPEGPPHKQAEIREAAEQFEALLLSQILRSARESGEEKGDSVTEFAEQHLASALAHNGGLGLAAMISKGLSKTPGV